MASTGGASDLDAAELAVKDAKDAVLIATEAVHLAQVQVDINAKADSSL
jgi:hypothetical protein